MSDRTYAKAQAQQKTSIGSPKKRALESSSTPTLVQENTFPTSLSARGAPHFGYDFSRIPISFAHRAGLQTKLKVNQPDDSYEQEADQVAEQVMRMTDMESSLADDEDEEKNSLMRKQSAEPGADAITEIPDVPPIVHAVLNSNGGQPLDATTRAFMEPRFGHDFSQFPIHPPTARVIQAKLAINQPGDQYEQEAERISQQVSATPASSAASDAPLAIQHFTEASNGQSHTAPASVGRALASHGSPPDPALRQDMERRFGHDFSKVRIHTDAGAAESAQDVNALAYTVGQDIVFSAGHYAPERQEGRRLIAHELTHVVQQHARQAVGIQRTPDVPAQPGTESTKIDPDANEATARAANPALPQIDQRKQTPLENDAAAQELVLEAFGGEKGLNTAFDTLSHEVKTQVDAVATADVTKARQAGVSQDADQVTTANRAKFLARMRLYFNNWKEVLDHFRAIEELSDGPVDLFLHRDAKVRLQRVLNVLKSKGHKLPTIHGGFRVDPYRGTDEQDNPIVQHKGMMIHLMGYAFDISAKANPKISLYSQKARGLERHDQDLLTATIGEEAQHMNLDLDPKKHKVPDNFRFTKDMGKRTADDTVAAADDIDPDTVEYFKQFEAQFNQMVKGSQAFTQSLSPAHREALLKIRSQYFTELRAIQDEKKKGAKADKKVIANHEAQGLKLLQSMPALMTEWIVAIDNEINKEMSKHPGMDKMRSPAEITHDLKSKQAEVQQAVRDEAQAQAAKEQAVAEHDAAYAAMRRATAAERHSPSGQAFQKAMEVTQAAYQRLFEKVHALAEALDKEIDTRHALATDTAARDALQAELKTSDTPKLQESWAKIGRLRELRQALAKPDMTPAGRAAYERLTTGDLSELTRDAASDNPPLLRLLDIGFFNPSGAFDLAFFEEAAHSGFWIGASWRVGSVDSMHFELAEGRNLLQDPGKS